MKRLFSFVILILLLASSSFAQKGSNGTFHIKKDARKGETNTRKIEHVDFTKQYKDINGRDSVDRYFWVKSDSEASVCQEQRGKDSIVNWYSFSEDVSSVLEIKATITHQLIDDLKRQCPSNSCITGKYYYEIRTFSTDSCDGDVIIGEEALIKNPSKFDQIIRLAAILDMEYKKYYGK